MKLEVETFPLALEIPTVVHVVTSSSQAATSRHTYGGQWASGIGFSVADGINAEIIISGENTVVHAEAGATVNGKKYT
ncbi:hypothetical protein BFGS084_01357 [Bacteroides fragilis]|nr:hypothetical protein BFGS084_01357 [Bacteroides fragilis]